MKKETFEKEMMVRLKLIEKQNKKIVDLVNNFKTSNPDVGMYSLMSVEKEIESPAFMTAWIIDKLNNTHYRKRSSVTNKIRKALGYYGYEKLK